jgi:hypothetical protein
MEKACMTRFVSHLLRFVLIVAGFIAAIVTASLFMLALVWGGMLRGDPETGRLTTLAVGLSVPVVAAFAGYYAFAPAIAFAVITEIAARRSWLFHALGGMAVAIIALAIRSDMTMRPGILMIVLAAGAAGGTAYWLVAGRSAGRHLDELSTSASKES